MSLCMVAPPSTVLPPAEADVPATCIVAPASTALSPLEADAPASEDCYPCSEIEGYRQHALARLHEQTWLYRKGEVTSEEAIRACHDITLEHALDEARLTLESQAAPRAQAPRSLESQASQSNADDEELIRVCVAIERAHCQKELNSLRNEALRMAAADAESVAAQENRKRRMQESRESALRKKLAKTLEASLGSQAPGQQ